MGLLINNEIVNIGLMCAAVPGVGEGPAKVVSVSLPEGTVLALREIAGTRGVSAFVSAAVERYLRDRLTDEYLGAYHREHGPFTPEEMREMHEIWADAERIAEREREEGLWPTEG